MDLANDKAQNAKFRLNSPTPRCSPIPLSVAAKGRLQQNLTRFPCDLFFIICFEEEKNPPGTPGGLLYIFWVRGRAIGKGIDSHDFGVRNGIDFHDFGIRNGINVHNFRNWYRVGYAFS